MQSCQGVDEAEELLRDWAEHDDDERNTTEEYDDSGSDSEEDGL